MARIRWLLVGMFLLLATSACSNLQLINFFSTKEYRLYTDIAYGTEGLQKLDIYVPSKNPQGTVVIFVHGGSWYNGDKNEYTFLGGAFANVGITTVAINYRVAPGGIFPDFVNDAALSVRWVKDNIDKFGGNPNRVFLMGQSAGSQIASLVALDPSYLAKVSLERKYLRGLISQAGPYTFMDYLENTQKSQFAMGPRESWGSTQPINFVDGQNPPMLLQQGLEDDTVDPLNQEVMVAALKAKGADFEAHTYPGIDHYEIIGALGTAARYLDPTIFDHLVNFIERH